MQAATFVEGFRLSPQQRKLWKLQDSTGDFRSFNSVLVLLLEGELRTDALREALERVCARHESLRTTFRRVPGVLMPVQSVERILAPSWRTIDLSDLTGSAQDDEVGALLALERRRTFDYENGPLVQATLLVLSSERALLSVCMPVLCGDRRTLANFGRSLSGCYAETVNRSELVDEALQYSQFSEWQNSLWEEEEDIAKAQEYWSRQDLSGAILALPGQSGRVSFDW